jgi:decaprenyl-phosphate phosphoribosyltransferase
MNIIALIQLMRPHQYIKNLFIFAPLFFSFDFQYQSIMATFVAFTLFSLLASSIYILNDFMDVEEDKQHPKKKYRPLASEAISKQSAMIVFIVLSTTALTLSFILDTKLLAVLLIYFVLNIVYSMKLKHVTIVDIFIIATGFVLRLFAGASVIGNQLSMWLIIMTFLLALFLAIAKRRDDVLLASQGKETRKNIDGYNIEFVNAVMVLMAGVVIVSYILYTVSQEVIDRLHTPYLYMTTFFVILGIMRYMQITFVEQNSGNPTKIALKDKFLKVTIVLWLLSFFIIVKGEYFIG